MHLKADAADYEARNCCSGRCEEDARSDLPFCDSSPSSLPPSSSLHSAHCTLHAANSSILRTILVTPSLTYLFHYCRCKRDEVTGKYSFLISPIPFSFLFFLPRLFYFFLNTCPMPTTPHPFALLFTSLIGPTCEMKRESHGQFFASPSYTLQKHKATAEPLPGGCCSIWSSSSLSFLLLQSSKLKCLTDAVKVMIFASFIFCGMNFLLLTTNAAKYT